VVDPGSERCRAHDDILDRTINVLPISRRESRSIESITSLGSIIASSRNAPPCSQSIADRKPHTSTQFISIGPEDLELKDDQAVQVESGRFELVGSGSK
jgi:hypothetical protein